MGKRTAPRIVGGNLRGIRLKSLPGNQTRPITDRVKENLFNIIGNDIVGSSFLDAFAGTGSVGIEAYSRGAGFIHFIEKNQRPFMVLSENLKLIKDSNKFQLDKTDAISFLKNVTSNSFDYIFIAPPQYKGIWRSALLAIDDNSNILSTDGWIMAQIDPIEYEPIDLNSLVEFDTRKYGSTKLMFFRNAPI